LTWIMPLHLWFTNFYRIFPCVCNSIFLEQSTIIKSHVKI
jgi:hypothetical protein